MPARRCATAAKRHPGYILEPDAKSAARVVYNHFGGKARFGDRISDAMMDAVDKADSAGFSKDDVLHPRGWELLSFLMDARTGLGRFRDFRVSNYQLMMMLIDCCRDMPIDEILALPDVKERVDLFFTQHALFRDTDRPAWPGCTTSWWCWTCGTSRPSTPATASWCTRCSRSATCRCT